MKAEYITRIEIDSLWNGRKRICWDLRRDVNVLSGINGVGKSTILNKVISALSSNTALQDSNTNGVKFTFSPEGAEAPDFDVIRSFDRPLMRAELLDKLVDKQVKSELDWQLYQLQRRYLDYQVNIGNRMIELLQKGDEDSRMQAMQIPIVKTRFQDLVDQLFAATGKELDRKSNEIRFLQHTDLFGVAHGDLTTASNVDELTPYQLSSGEKQLLVILLTVLVQEGRAGVLFMDEPEISLHIDWQQRLINLIRELNPNVQIILTTHSPAVIMDGWLDAVTEVNDITL